MKKIKILTAFALSILAVLGIASAQTYVWMPMSVYGTLKINGNLVPAGARMRGYVNGVEVTYYGPYYTESNGIYGSESIMNTQFHVQCAPGDPVSMRVESPAGTAIYYDIGVIAACDPGGTVKADINYYGNPWSAGGPVVATVPPASAMVSSIGTAIAQAIMNIRAWFCGTLGLWC